MLFCSLQLDRALSHFGQWVVSRILTSGLKLVLSFLAPIMEAHTETVTMR